MRVRCLVGLFTASFLWSQHGVNGFGRTGFGAAYGNHFLGASFRLPLGYSEFTFVEVTGGTGRSKVPHLEGMHQGYVLGMGMNQGILGTWLMRDCKIYWFLPYLDLGTRVYLYPSLPQPDGNGGTAEKSVFVPDLYVGFGTLFNVVRHVELFGAVRLRNEIINDIAPAFDWQAGLRISVGY